MIDESGIDYLNIGKKSAKILADIYPNADKCVNGHGKTVYTFHRELDDDRYYIIKSPHCKRCRMPVGADEYASPEEDSAYWRQHGH